MSKSRNTNILDSFIYALNENSIQPTAEELADALWLSIKTSHLKTLTNDQSNSIRKPGEDKTIEDENIFLHNEPVGDLQTCDKKNDHINDSHRDFNEDEIPVYAKNNINDGSLFYQTIRITSTELLPEKLDIERSLRPLMLKVPSSNKLILNEEETVKRIVEEKIWLPVFKGIPERDYDMAVIVDVSESMLLWQSMLYEFRMLLEHQGAFRVVRVWKVNGDSNSVHLYSDSTDNNESRVCSPHEIIDNTRNRFVLVISDCIAEFWYSNDMIKMMNLWGQKHPVAIVQMLPHRLWPSTALSKGRRVKLRSNTTIKSNHQLMIDDPFMKKKHTNDILKIPVITLEHQIIAIWAKTITGHSDSWLSGYVFELKNENDSQQDISSELNRQTTDVLSAEDRLRNFLLFASPPAQKLARYLSSAPLTLPIMRLVQQVMLPDSKIIHLAEFFLSGLIKRIPIDTTNPLALKYEYDFYEGVRDLLFGTILIPEAINVTEKVSLYLEKHYGYISDFQALLLKPEKADIKPDMDLHFASIKARVLRKMGGDYTQLAENYIQVSKNFRHYSTTKKTKELERKEKNEAQNTHIRKRDKSEIDKTEKKLSSAKGVFLSYNRKNEDFAAELYRRLSKDGVDCFFDKESIKWGENWFAKLERSIEQSESFVMILTPDYFKSEWKFIEGLMTSDPLWTTKKIIALLLEPCDHMMPHFLKTITIIDITTPAKFDKEYPLICRLIGDNQVSMPQPKSEDQKLHERISLRILPYLIGRTEQVEVMTQSIVQFKNNNISRKPLVWIIHGDEMQCHDSFMDCIGNYWSYLWPADPGPFPNLRMIPLAHLPFKYDINDWKIIVTNDIKNRLFMKKNIPLNVFFEVNRFCDNRYLLLFYVLDLSEWLSWGKDLFSRFFEFWNQWPTIDSRNPLIVCLLVKYESLESKKELKYFFQKRNTIKKNDELKKKVLSLNLKYNCIVIPELVDISWHDSRAWYYHFKDIIELYSHANVLKCINEIYANKETLPMEVVVSELNKKIFKVS